MNPTENLPRSKTVPSPGGLAAVRTRDQRLAASNSPETGERKLLSSSSDLDVARWVSARPKPADYRAFRARRERATASIERARRWIARLASKGGRLPPEVRAIEESAAILWSTSRETSDALKKGALSKLVWVESNAREIFPRAYAVARDFLCAEEFSFDEKDLVAYAAAAQKREPLNINEVWALKPMLLLVLLEEIGTRADALCVEMKRTSERFSLRAAASPGSVAPLLLALDAVDRARWTLIFEAASRTEAILRQDPSGTYPRMDADSRGLYRKAVSDLAAHSRAREAEVAALAVSFARRLSPAPGETARIAERRQNAGYYLLDEGRDRLEARVRYRPPFHEKVERFIRAWPELVYIVGIELVTAGIIVFLLSGLHRAVPPLSAIALLLLPATESAVRIMNQLTTFLIRPRGLPKLDFSGGIPPGCSTLVVIPTLLISADQVRQTAADLEIRYLANADPNLHFGLLTDSPDSARRFDEHDQLVELCSRLIEELNQKYAKVGKGSFFLFHRHRMYNPVENAWMGWERKRGKLLDLNRLLRRGADSFPVKVGNLSLLPQIRYVITLDSDTSLPREAAHRLVGAIAHPLNKAVTDPKTNTVTKGYGILQPRVGVSVHSATRSRLASFLSGQSGFDIYTRAISDVYQDLFSEGSYTGKGIYEVDVYQQVLGERFPPNALLSHDLIEGSYARAGLVSDIEVIDDYPSHFSAYSRRKHRWIRGDWQILRWLWFLVPDFAGRMAPNPIPFISRWKIIDNLRRSLIEAATLALLVSGWFFLAGGAAYWTVATLVLLLMPSYVQLFLSLIFVAGSENWRGFLSDAVRNFVAEQVNVLLTLVFLFHQTLVTLDAIIRTLVRLMVTHKKLLEWETAAQAELKQKKRTPVEICLDLSFWFSFALGVALAYFRPHSLPVALPFLIVWACSKPMSRWVNEPPLSRRKRPSRKDEAFLRETALRSWRFFREWSHAGTNWLIPDHVQESPPLVSNVISPTNLGFLVGARLAAFDLGYLTLEEFAHETEQTLSTALRMRRFKGHFLNWNRIDTLEPLNPLFVSTVDSGNLAACLWTLKQGCLEMIGQPLWREASRQGLLDEWNLLSALAANSSKGTTAVLGELQRHFEALTKPGFEWIDALPGLERDVERLETFLGGEVAASDRDERRWWTRELRARLASLRYMVASLTPWLLGEYSTLFRMPDDGPGIANLTIENLPDRLETLGSSARKLLGNDQVLPEIRSQAQSFLARVEAATSNARTLVGTLRRIAGISDALVMDMDFAFLHQHQSELLSVGYDVKNERLEGAAYGMLASEARTASFIAIAKGDIRQEHWFHLGRSHTVSQGQRLLLSWSGTMFEYLMPALWMRCYLDTILGQSQQSSVRYQQRFAKRKRRPWGVSEAGWGKTDEAGHYQYRAFGIPELALSPNVPSDVVAPYATFLALEIDPEPALKNLRRMKRMRWSGVYGFYESADYSQSRRNQKAKYELVRSWMAHHQGMTLLSLCNYLADSSIQRRFHAEPRFLATELILHERVPPTVPIVPPEAHSSVLKIFPDADAAMGAA